MKNMTVQQADISKVRASILQQLGSRVMIRLDKGRHRIDVQEGVINGAYSCVFTILIDENEDNPQKLMSFSYTDVLTKNIRMRLC